MDVHPAFVRLDRRVPLHVVDVIPQRTLDRLMQNVQELGYSVRQ